MGRSRAIQFLSGILVTAGLVTIIGWFTGVRVVMHSVLLGLFVTAFLPFVLVAAVLGTVMVGMLLLVILSMLSDGAGGESVDGGADLIEKGAQLGGQGGLDYYRLLFTIRHPVIWGSVAGLLAGGLILWGVLSWVVVPRELLTTQILTDCAQRLTKIHGETGRFPAPTPDGFLAGREVGQADDAPVLDAFGRPLYFTTTGRGVFASFTLKSYGFDEKPGQDDFCASGAGKGAELAGRFERLLSRIRIGKDGKQPRLKDRLQTLRALQCEER